MDTSIPERFSDEMLLHNEIIKAAYYSITTKIISLFKKFIIPELRTRIEVQHIPELDPDLRIHELLTPYLYLSLSISPQGCYLIYFARNLETPGYIGHHNYIRLSRIIYEETGANTTITNIENCLEEYGFNLSKYNNLYQSIQEGRISNANLITEELEP